MVDLAPGVAAIMALIDQLATKDRDALLQSMTTASAEAAVLAALEGLVGPDRRCPHCQAPGARKRGVVSTLIRYACTACGKTFNALTGTPLARLRMKDRWLDLAASLSQAETLKRCAARCGVSERTAFRWRHRLLGTTATRAKVVKLGGTTEIDPTHVRHSEKGSRRLSGGRKPRKRGGAQGLGSQMVPVLMAQERGGDMVASVLQAENAGSIRYALGDHLKRGTVIITDAAKNFTRAFRKMGMHHEPVNIARKQRIRGPYHIKTINALHGHFHDFMAPFKGVATKYLPNYLEWFRMVGHHHAETPFACLSAVMEGAAMARA
jgi:transposase-like protein